jgi:hypothetical protein
MMFNNHIYLLEFIFPNTWWVDLVKRNSFSQKVLANHNYYHEIESFGG